MFPPILNMKAPATIGARFGIGDRRCETLTLQHRYASTTTTMAYQKTFFDTYSL